MEGTEDQKHLSPAEYERQLRNLVNAVSTDMQAMTSWRTSPPVPVSTAGPLLDQQW